MIPRYWQEGVGFIVVLRIRRGGCVMGLVFRGWSGLGSRFFVKHISTVFVSSNLELCEFDQSCAPPFLSIMSLSVVFVSSNVSLMAMSHVLSMYAAASSSVSCVPRSLALFGTGTVGSSHALAHISSSMRSVLYIR